MSEHALATEIVRISKYPEKYPLVMAQGFYILLGMAQQELEPAAPPVHPKESGESL